jgi:hypothetical protein
MDDRLDECEAGELFSMGLDVASCVRFLDWNADRHRKLYGKSSFAEVLKAGAAMLRVGLKAAGYHF